MLRLNLDSRLADYGFGDPHPFGTDRQGVFWDEARRRGLDTRVAVHSGRRATDDELQLFHRPDYLRRAAAQSKIGFGYLDGGDTPARLGIFEAARHVVGSALEAAADMLDAGLERCFQPIGGLHHGRRDGAGGFCVLNDCGVVIEYLKRRGVGPIAYVDIDAHHGDGVYYAFEDDPAVIVADLHEDGRHLYPGTGSADESGTGSARGTKLNLPMDPGSGDAEFDRAWERALSHVAGFRPQFYILQAGADSIGGDPLSHLAYTTACHRRACRDLAAQADAWAEGRLLVFGGGGYHRGNIADTWCQVADELALGIDR